MKLLSEKMLAILERLAEMFPKHDYQAKLERYIAARHPQHPGDVEHLMRQFDLNQQRGYL